MIATVSRASSIVKVDQCFKVRVDVDLRCTTYQPYRPGGLHCIRILNLLAFKFSLIKALSIAIQRRVQ